MKVKYIINNYQLGAKFKITPTHKALIRKIDKFHTEVIYEDITQREYELCNKCFAKCGVIL